MIREYDPVDIVARYTLYPATPVEVLAFHDSSTVCWTVTAKPVAVSDAEVELLAIKEILAVAVPAAVGAKVNVKGALWPAASVIGRVSPATVKAELLELAEDKVTLPPFAITVPLCVWVLPIVTLPKLIEPGVTPMVPLVVVPLPVRRTVTDESAAFDAMARLALFVPELVGENVTERFALAPAAKE